MKFLKRIGFYLIGVALGSILVFFIWEGKDVAFPYGPNSRTLSSIQKKRIELDSTVAIIFNEKKIDSIDIRYMLTHGEVDFKKSNPRLKPCAEYFIRTMTIDSIALDIYLERCDSIATIKQAFITD